MHGGKFCVVAILAIVCFIPLAAHAAFLDQPIPPGSIIGQCVGWPHPHIEIRWSATPPPGVPSANANSVLRGINGAADNWFFAGGWPGVVATQISGATANPWGPGGYPSINYNVHDLRDDSVVIGNTYEYYTKYRPETPSVNDYQVTVNSGNCGGPPNPPTPTPPPATPAPMLVLTPVFQEVLPNTTAFLHATGGDGTYRWVVPGGSVSGSGADIGVLYTNGALTAVIHAVAVYSGNQVASASVQVDGVATFQDDIVLTAPGDRFVLINGGADVTGSPDVQLTLSHGFAGQPDSGITMQLFARPALASSSAPQPFSATAPWNLCGGAATCPAGLYTVYAQFTDKNGVVSEVVLDSIVYLPSAQSGTPGVTINNGAPQTSSGQVTLTLQDGFGPGTTDDMVTMQVANTAGGVSTAAVLPYSPTLGNWDLCAGTCSAGPHTVYVQYCSPTACQAVVHATIALVPVTPVPTVTVQSTASPIQTQPPQTPIPQQTSEITPDISVQQGQQNQGGGTSVGVSGASADNGGVGGLVSGLGDVFTRFIGAISTAVGVIGPISVAAAVAVGASAIAALTPLLLPGLGSFLWQQFMAMLGLLPSRKNVWGTVYDSGTKRPIPYAKVQLLDHNHRVLETRVADKDGRYGFLATPESLRAQNVQILILPAVPEYLFPSHASATVDTFIYNNLYYGELITVSQETLINFDIPMDPLRPSNAPLVVTSPSILLGAGVAVIADAGFWFGLIMVPLAFALNPNPFTFATMCLFLGTASLRVFGISEHPFGTVTDATTGAAMSFALITLNEQGGKRVAFTVSDEQGRYFMVAPKGTYQLTASTSAMVRPTRQIHEVIEVRKGWITRELKL